MTMAKIVTRPIFSSAQASERVRGMTRSFYDRNSLMYGSDDARSSAGVAFEGHDAVLQHDELRLVGLLRVGRRDLNRAAARATASCVATKNASRSWCVTTIELTPSRSRSLMISSSTVVAVIGSSPVVGSSYSRMRGLAAIARAIATRRRWPPESSDGMRSMYSPQADEPEHLLDAPPRLVRGHVASLRTACSRRSPRRSASRRARLPGTPCRGRRAPSSAPARSCSSTRSPLTQIVPPSGFSRPRISFRIVDLPEPLAPRMILVWPGSSVKLTSCRTTLSSNASDTLSKHDRSASADASSFSHGSRRVFRPAPVVRSA